jgi:carboxypeptidase family protein
MRSMFSVLAIVVALAVCSAMGQSTFGSVVGVVQDKTQAVVPGATVTIRRLEDNSSRSATSDQNGSFEFLNLKPGTYAFSAQADGFAEFRVPSAELTSRQTLRIDVTLGIKSQSQSVEVADTVAVINTENAVISDSKDNQQITQLPLNNRGATTSPLAALSLSPNVQQDSSGNIALDSASSAMVNFSVSQRSRLLLPVPDALATPELVSCRAPAQSRPALASLSCFALRRQSECASSPRLPTC